MTQKVLRPWTAIEVGEQADSKTVSVWGRKYQFQEGPLPSQLESAGRQMLAGPIAISATVNGSAVEWEDDSLQVAAAAPAEATLQYASRSELLQAKALITVEYDGMLRVDWNLELAENARLDELSIDIPLNTEHASLFYVCPRRDQPDPGTGIGRGSRTPRERFATGFSPYLWLGDEERGLAWFCESAENWTDDGLGDAIELVPEEDRVTLRLHPVRESATRDNEQGGTKSLSYTFGLQATPVKPVEKSAWDTRIFHVCQELAEFTEIRLQIPTDTLDTLANSGVKTVCIHEHWTDIEGYFATDYGDDLKQLVENCHARGMQVLLYFGFLISDLAPEWPSIGAECVVHPDDKGCYVPYNYPPQPLQNAYTVCYNSRWREVTTAGVAKVLCDYKIDGIYLDGTTIPWGCKNPQHGCGYTQGDGTLGYTYPIFAVRELMRSLYESVLANNPVGQVNIHASYYLTIPTIAWSTGYTNGEQFAWDEVEQQQVSGSDGISGGTHLSLERFRCEFMGHPLGVPADFLADIRGPFADLSAACAYSLLHDIPTRIWMRFDFTLQKQLWVVRDDFGCTDAEWLPYWRNAEYVTTDTPGTYCSLHRHPRKGVLAVIANLNSEAKSVTAEFNFAILGLAEEVVVHDQLQGSIAEMAGGAVTSELSPLGWRLLRIENK